MSQSPEAPRRPSWLRIGLLLASYAAIMVIGHLGGRWLEQSFGLDMAGADGAGAGDGARTVLVLGLLLYIVLLALPFVPGIEISLALFAAFGAQVALPIYLATLVALLASYLAGRCVALARLAACFDFIGLRSGAELVRRLGPMTPRQRIAMLVEAAPTRLGRVLLRYRELALIAALNIPGNALIGGGGGIALLAGMSGVFPIGRYLLATALASAPVPLTMALAGQIWR